MRNVRLPGLRGLRVPIVLLLLILVVLSLPSLLSRLFTPPFEEEVGNSYTPLVVSPEPPLIQSPPPAAPSLEVPGRTAPEAPRKAPAPASGKVRTEPSSSPPLRDPFAYEPERRPRPSLQVSPPPLPLLSPPELPLPSPEAGTPQLPEKLGEAQARGGRAALVVRWRGDELVLPDGISVRLEGGVALARKEGGKWRFWWNGKEVQLQ